MKKSNYDIGYNESKIALNMLISPTKSVLEMMHKNTLNERNNSDPSTYDYGWEYDDRMDWIDGSLDYLEEFIENNF
tara:strand:+ start:3476 stop:3703 length:228 start_codon:yes stop_codon:yes gene_type:complete